jgi:hypothetical protein
MGFSVHEGLRLSGKAGGEGLLVEVDDSGVNGATSDRLERDRFALGGATCSPACDEDSGVCASEGLRSRDEDACDEDNGVCASEVLRSRDEDVWDEDNGVRESEALRSVDMVVVKTGWDA